jgi:hypothetical protein
LKKILKRFNFEYRDKNFSRAKIKLKSLSQWLAVALRLRTSLLSTVIVPWATLVLSTEVALTSLQVQVLVSVCSLPPQGLCILFPSQALFPVIFREAFPEVVFPSAHSKHTHSAPVKSLSGIPVTVTLRVV